MDLGVQEAVHVCRHCPGPKTCDGKMNSHSEVSKPNLACSGFPPSMEISARSSLSRQKSPPTAAEAQTQQFAPQFDHLVMIIQSHNLVQFNFALGNQIE